MGNNWHLFFPILANRLALKKKNYPNLVLSLSSFAISVIIVAVAIADVYLVRIADPDLWGHLMYGRYFIENGIFNVKDPFSYTATGQTWYAHEYLSQILLWLAYSGGGSTGLILLKCFIGGLTVFTLYLSVRLISKDLVVWSPIFLLSITQLSRFLLFRPQLFSYLGFSIFVFVIFKYLLYRRSPLWILPITMLLWSNLHGGFLAGIGVLGLGLCLSLIQSYYSCGLKLALIFKEIRPVLFSLVSCLGVTFLNPLGWRIWPFLVKELSNPYNRKYINEWQPVSLGSLGANDVIMLFFILSMIITALIVTRISSNIKGLRPWQWLASCLPLALMFFLSNRHAPLLLLWSTPIFVLFGQAIWDSPIKQRLGVRSMRLIFTGLALFYALTGFFVTFMDPLPKIEITERSLGVDQPFGSVEFMRLNHLQGNVFAPLWWGSFLTWELFPNILVAMDGRNDTLYPVEMVGENLEFYFGLASTDTPLRYDTDYLLVETGSPVLNEIQLDRHWVKLYEDSGSILFINTESEQYPENLNLRTGSFQQPVLRRKTNFP